MRNALVNSSTERPILTPPRLVAALLQMKALQEELLNGEKVVAQDRVEDGEQGVTPRARGIGPASEESLVNVSQRLEEVLQRPPFGGRDLP